MEVLRRINKKKLDKLLNEKTAEEFENWLESIDLLHKERTCPGKNGRLCGNMMRKIIDHRGIKLWRCGKNGCHKELGYRLGTFFEHQHLTAKQVSPYIPKPKSESKLRLYMSLA